MTAKTKLVHFVAMMLCALVLSLALQANSAHEAAAIRAEASPDVEGLVQALTTAAVEGQTAPSVQVVLSGSGNAIKALGLRQCGVAFTTRFMRATEFESCVEHGVLPTAHPLALDSLAVVVHRSNPVTELTVEHVKAIYAGRTRDWADLGGPPGPIVPYSRDTNSTSYGLFETAVMNGERVSDRSEYIRYVGSGGSIGAEVASDPGGIGYLHPFVVHRASVTPLAVDGVVLTDETVGNGTYPLVKPLDADNDWPRHRFVPCVDQGLIPEGVGYAMDTFEVIVHPSNPIREVSIEQLKGIYSGRIRDWSELGGPSGPIVPYSRNARSPTCRLFQQIVLRGEELSDSAEYLRYTLWPGATRAEVASNPSGIGYAYPLAARTAFLKTLAIDGVALTEENVRNGTYPVVRPFLAFTNGYPELGSNLHRLITLPLTRDGSRAIREAGYIPLVAY